MAKRCGIVKKIKERILQIKTCYAATPYDPRHISSCTNANIQFTINDQLFWDMILLELRGLTIPYAAKKKRESQEQEKIVINNISLIENSVNTNPNNFVDKVEELDNHDDELE
jgi:hypothetical protein